MADFKTHLIGAAAVSGVAATALVMAKVASHQAVMGYFSLGVVGGLLPDIDSDTSIPLRIAFNALAVISGFMVVFALGHRYSLAELIILWLLCFVAVRYGVFSLFTALTVHRGLLHSLPAGAFFGLSTTCLAFYFLRIPASQAWTGGCFIMLGFMVHLLLDEFYSVDLMGAQLKSSFGTAFNLGSLSDPLGTAILYLAVFGLFHLSPPLDGFVQTMLNGDAYGAVADRLLPRQDWFRGLF